MANRTKAVCLLLPLLGTVGCHPAVPEAVQRVQREHSHQKELFTDQVSLLFAEQELALAHDKVATANAAGRPVDGKAEQDAEHHLQQARLKLRLDQDNEQLDKDRSEWEAFATMLKATQPHEGHS